MQAFKWQTVDAEEARFGVSGIEDNATITAPAWRERKRTYKGNESPDEENAVNILTASSSKALQISACPRLERLPCCR